MIAVLLSGVAVFLSATYPASALAAKAVDPKADILSAPHLIISNQSQALEPVSRADGLSRLPIGSYNTASVHFIGFEQSLEFTGMEKLGFSDVSADNCKRMGYNLTSCSNGWLSGTCPYNPSYFKECCSSDYKYSADNCKYPNSLSSDSCGGKYRCLCDTGVYPYTKCSSPLVPQTGSGSTCTAYGKTYYSDCICPSSYSNTCSGQNQLGKGTGCTKNGVTKYTACECKSGYNLTCSGNGYRPARASDYCLNNGTRYYNSCCMNDETNCAYGTYNCSNGCGGTRKCCKVCDPNDRDCKCPGYVYCGDTKTGSGDTCTAGGKTFFETCLVQEKCMVQSLYCGVVDKSNSWHASNYKYVRPYCTAQTGETLNLYVQCPCELEGVRGPCYGKKQCTDNLGHQKDGSTEPCVCGSFKWFDICDETCVAGDSISKNQGACFSYPVSSVLGMFFIKEKCKTSSGTVVNYFATCNGKDCNGNEGPCYGKKKCSSGTIAIDPCSCGGEKFGSSCVIECPYEDTETSCAVHGRSFKQRCKDNNGTWYGECI